LQAYASFPPMSGSVGHASWQPDQIRQRRASAAVSESTHGPEVGGALACLPVDPAFARSPQVPAQICNSLAFPLIPSRRRAPRRPTGAFLARRCVLRRLAVPVPTSLVPR
jgi:hypothetical protein